MPRRKRYCGPNSSRSSSPPPTERAYFIYGSYGSGLIRDKNFAFNGTISKGEGEMKLTKSTKKLKIERRIDEKLDKLLDEAKTPEEISKVVILVTDKYKMQTAKPCIKPDTIALIAANLLGIVLILHYEKLDVVTSKALGFVVRGRV